LAIVTVHRQKTHTAFRSVLSGIPTGDRQDSPLKAEIRPTQISVKNDEDFSVITSIHNTSSEGQSIWVLYCGYSIQWTADNPSVHLDSTDACAKNSPWKVSLKPGEAYEKTVLVRVALSPGNGQSKAVTFRLGFEDMAYTTVQNAPRIWSNAVTVNVTR